MVVICRAVAVNAYIITFKNLCDDKGKVGSVHNKS
jgi:hypothetical protein